MPRAVDVTPALVLVSARDSAAAAAVVGAVHVVACNGRGTPRRQPSRRSGDACTSPGGKRHRQRRLRQRWHGSRGRASAAAAGRATVVWPSC